MQTRNLDAYRSQAEATSSLNLSLPPALSSGPRQNTEKALNRMRLTMYIQQIDGSTLDIVDDAEQIKEWIKTHTVETQVFLNVLGASPALVEDGVRGTKTVNCINILLGISVPAITSVAGSITATPGENGEISITLPDFLKSEAEARAVIAALGIEGVRIEDGKIIGINEINTQNKLELLKKYLDYANYLETGDANPEGLMTRYKELLDYPTNFIEDKKYLIMKYSSAIYEEIIKAGYQLEPIEGTNGSYEITEFLTGKPVTSSVFEDFVSGEHVREEYIEFARLNSIVGGESSFWKERMVTREGLVDYILENNSIVSEALKNAGITQDAQKIEAILLNKDEVVRQLKQGAQRVRGSSENTKKYQEAMWLITFLEQEQYKQNDLQKALFNNVNHYNKVFQAEHSFVDALTAQGIDPETADPSDPDVISSLQKVLGKHTIGIALLGIFTMIFGGQHKGKGFWLLAGLFGAKVGLGVAQSTMQEVQEHRDDGKIGGDAFDIFDPIKLRHRVKYEAGFNREDYDPTLEKLYTANDSRIAEGEINNGTAQLLTNNARIALIFQGVMSKDELLRLDFKTADSNALVETIFKGLDNNTIEASSFDSRIAASQIGEKVTENDVKVFVELLRATSVETDKTLHDAFLEKESVLSEDYENIDFTGDQHFNAALNKHLRERWDANSPSATLSISEATKGRKEIQEVIELLQTSLSNGTFDGVFDWGSTLNWDNFNRNAVEQVSIIESLITNINGNADIGAATKNALTQADGILPRLQTYIRGKDTLAEMSLSTGIIETMKGLTIGNDPTILEKQLTDINTLIAKLDPTKFVINSVVVNLEDDDIFKNLVKDINAKKSELQVTKLDISRKLLEVITNEKEETIKRADLLEDSIARFNSRGKTDIAEIVPTLTDNYEALKDTWDEVSAGGHAVGSVEEEIFNKLEPLFKSGGKIETLKTDLQSAFETYFSRNKNIIDTQITPTSLSTTPTITEINAAIAKFRSIEDDVQNELGTLNTFFAYMQPGVPQGPTEAHYSSAREIFPTLRAASDANTLYEVGKAAIDKQKAVAQVAFNFINRLSSSTITAGDFDKLHKMKSNDIIGFIEDMMPSSNIGKIFTEKYAQAGVIYIQAIPSSQVGITQLRNFENFYLNTNPSWIDTIASIGSSDPLTPAFETQVSVVASSILRTDFTEDIAGLKRIIAFNATSEYNFIKKHGTNFDTEYAARLQEIRTNVSQNALAGFGMNETGLDELIIFINSSDYPLLSDDRSHEAVFNTKAENILKSILEDTAKFPDTITGIGNMITFKADPRYVRFNSSSLASIFELTLLAKQDRVRQATLTSGYTSITTEISTTARALSGDPASIELLKLLSSTHDKLSHVVSIMGLTHEEPDRDYNGIPLAIRKNTFDTLRPLNLI